MKDLFVGVTTWNSAAFLPVSLEALRKNTDAKRTRLMILDNNSTDDTIAIARSFGAEVVWRKQSSQGAALIDLFNSSRSEFTLLLHADVVLLTPQWFEASTRHLAGNVALVSPEDIGCGPYTRPWGRGMPESSFLLFRTALGRKTRRWYKRQRFKLTIPFRGID